MKTSYKEVFKPDQRNDLNNNKYIYPRNLMDDYLNAQIMPKVGIWTILAKKPPTLWGLKTIKNINRQKTGISRFM